MAIATAMRNPRWEYPEPGTKKSFLLSLAAHSLLALMFMVGLNWKTSSTPAGVEVELWDNSPPQVIEQVIAEKVMPVMDEKAEIVVEKKKVEPKVEPPKKAEVKPAVPTKPVEKEKPKTEVKPKVEPPKDKPKAKEEVKEKSKAPPLDAKQKDAEEKERTDRITKMQAAAAAESGGSGGTSGAGTGTGGVATPGWADRVRRVIRANITFYGADQVKGNPAAHVIVDLAPDGKILQSRLSKTSGLSDWDAAVLRAIDITGTLPKDDNGTVPKSIVLIFRQKD
jgi:colicin import membrane protein